MTMPPAWRPSATEELLLDAAIGPEAGAAAAFSAWRRAQPLDDVGEGSQRLLPLLVPRSRVFDANDSAWPIIRGIYRRAFFRGQLQATRAVEALAHLQRAGIPTMLLKGGALLPYYDDNVALRPMNDLDVLVPARHAIAAIHLLLAHGWASALPHPHELPRAYHGACFTSPDGFDVDVHWQPLPAAEPASEAALWDESEPALRGGVATGVPCAADLLVIVCAHATQWSPTSPVRWVADACRILQRNAGGFDWERVLDSARRWRVTLQLGDTLAYLSARWDVDVPPDLLRALACAPVAAVDRRAYGALSTQPGWLGYLARPWRRYRLRVREGSAEVALPGFIDYLRVTLGRTHARQLPMEIVRRVLRYRRSRRRSGVVT